MLKSPSGQLTLLVKTWTRVLLHKDTPIHSVVFIFTPTPTNICQHTYKYISTQLCALYWETAAGAMGPLSLPGYTALLFPLLALGKLAQVEPVDLKVVEW